MREVLYNDGYKKRFFLMDWKPFYNIRLSGITWEMIVNDMCRKDPD